jgi:hypothetical protein
MAQITVTPDKEKALTQLAELSPKTLSIFAELAEMRKKKPDLESKLHSNWLFIKIKIMAL